MVRTPKEPQQADSCLHPARALFARYAWQGGCSETEEIEFEAHLLACDVCFQDLRAVDRVIEIASEFGRAPDLRPALQISRARRDRTRA